MKAVPINRFLVFLSIASLGVAADLLSKYWAFKELGIGPSGRSIEIFGRVLLLETTLNEGGLFGVGQGFSFPLSILAMCALTGIVLWLFVFGAAEDWLLTVALGGVVGGILGNLYDRLGFHNLLWEYGRPGQPDRIGEPVYAVRDWIHFQIESIGFDFPLFNIADSLLVCGAALLMWHAIRGEPTEEKSATVEHAAG